MSGLNSTKCSPHDFACDPMRLVDGHANLWPNVHQNKNENAVSIARLILVAWVLLMIFWGGPSGQTWPWLLGPAALAAWWALQRYDLEHGKGGAPALPRGGKAADMASKGLGHQGDPADLSDIPGATAGGS